MHLLQFFQRLPRYVSGHKNFSHIYPIFRSNPALDPICPTTDAAFTLPHRIASFIPPPLTPPATNPAAYASPAPVRSTTTACSAATNFTSFPSSAHDPFSPLVITTTLGPQLLNSAPNSSTTSVSFPNNSCASLLFTIIKSAFSTTGFNFSFPARICVDPGANINFAFV